MSMSMHAEQELAEAAGNVAYIVLNPRDWATDWQEVRRKVRLTRTGVRAGAFEVRYCPEAPVGRAAVVFGRRGLATYLALLGSTVALRADQLGISRSFTAAEAAKTRAIIEAGGPFPVATYPA